ncbi:MAG: hypothetical protein JG718_17725 [Candidatus Thiothrix moscowensis]|nr:hypothetical protein [Candidatus Thiothrix moscowensis]
MSAKPIVVDSPARNNSENSANNPLTEKPQGATLENVPGSNTRHDFKQTKGGNVKDTQPPAMSGFFVPAACPRDCNKLPGVARNRTPRSGNTCSVSFRTLEGSRQPYNCQNFKQTKEDNAMKTANTPAQVAPATGDKGLTPTLPVCGQDKTIFALPRHELTYGQFNDLLVLKTKLEAIDQTTHPYAVILWQDIQFFDDGEAMEAAPYADIVFPAETENANGWECHPVDDLLFSIYNAMEEQHRNDIGLFLCSLALAEKQVKTAKVLKGGCFDPDEVIEKYISPLEAKIKAIREQQAVMGGNE